MAGESGGESNEDEDELFDGDLDDIEDSDVGPENRPPVPLQFAVDEDMAAAFEALRHRAVERAIRSLSPVARFQKNYCDSDVAVDQAMGALRNQGRLPDIQDSHLFSVQVKVRITNPRDHIYSLSNHL